MSHAPSDQLVCEVIVGEKHLGETAVAPCQVRMGCLWGRFFDECAASRAVLSDTSVLTRNLVNRMDAIMNSAKCMSFPKVLCWGLFFSRIFTH